jgi:hypothetical protein
MEMLLNSLDAVRVQLKHTEKAYRLTLRKLRSGESVTSALVEAGAAEVRRATTEAIERFEKCRNTSRTSLVAMELDEGSSISSVSRTWGFSRQLVARYVNRLK